MIVSFRPIVCFLAIRSFLPLLFQRMEIYLRVKLSKTVFRNVCLLMVDGLAGNRHSESGYKVVVVFRIVEIFPRLES